MGSRKMFKWEGGQGRKEGNRRKQWKKSFHKWGGQEGWKGGEGMGKNNSAILCKVRIPSDKNDHYV